MFNLISRIFYVLDIGPGVRMGKMLISRNSETGNRARCRQLNCRAMSITKNFLVIQ